MIMMENSIRTYNSEISNNRFNDIQTNHFWSTCLYLHLKKQNYRVIIFPKFVKLKKICNKTECKENKVIKSDVANNAQQFLNKIVRSRGNISIGNDHFRIRLQLVFFLSVHANFEKSNRNIAITCSLMH